MSDSGNTPFTRTGAAPAEAANGAGHALGASAEAAKVEAVKTEAAKTEPLTAVAANTESHREAQVAPKPEHGGAGGGGDGAKAPHKLSTLSPEALRVAAEITPHRLANLLIRKGPLAIRVITAQLAAEVPGFELLSLLKQRRLIMAAMEQEDPANNVVFEKIGWGQWAVRRTDLDYIVTDAGTGPVSVHELREKAKLGWSKKSANAARRDSFTHSRGNLHNVRVPDEQVESASESDMDDGDDEMDDGDSQHIDVNRPAVHHFTMRVQLEDADDNAIAEDSDEDDLFAFEQDGRHNKSPPMFADRVPTKTNSPPALASRRKSSSAAPNGVSKNTNYNTRHQIFGRNRLNSLENLDNYIVSSARNSSFSVSLPPPAGSAGSGSPLGSWSNNQGAFVLVEPMVRGRRKLSFNESSMRSTLLASHGQTRGGDGASDTDEEDWASIGAASLRKTSAGLSPSLDQTEERTAARALVNLMTI